MINNMMNNIPNLNMGINNMMNIQGMNLPMPMNAMKNNMVKL